jgi:hypothetical protein
MNLWRRLRHVLPAAFVLLCLAFPGARTGSAQTLNNATITATTIGAKEKADIEQYVRACLQLLVEGSDEEVARARERLLDPFQKNPSAVFRVAYNEAVAAEMSKIGEAPRPITKLNAMIALTRIDNPRVVDILRLTLGDESPSVRFWAARVAAESANFTTLQAQHHAALRKDLAAAIAREPVREVLVEMFKALAEIDDGSILLPLIRAQVNAQATGNAELFTVGHIEGLTRFYRRFQQNPTKNPAVATELAWTAWQLMELAARELAQGNVTPEQEAQLTRVILDSDTVLRAAVNVVAPTAKVPTPDVKDLVKNKRWEDVQIRNRDWNPILTNPPVNINPAALPLPVKAPR